MKPPKRRGNKRVTLLSCIPCYNRAKSNAFVITADSQETSTEYDEHGNSYEVRRTVQKIAPLDIGNIQVVIAGSGDTALILAFIEKLKRKLRSSQLSTISEFLNLTELELMAFYQADVAASNGGSLSLFLAAAFRSTGEFGAWQQCNVTLIPIAEPTLEGWAHKLYEKTLERACHANLTTEQAILAGIHVLSIAEATSNYVRGPMSAVVIDNQGIRPVDGRYIQDVASRIAEYEEHLNNIFLACSDTTESVPDLEDRIEAFKKTAVALHRAHIDQEAAKTGIGDLLDGDKPLRNLPPGPIAFSADGKLTVEHDRDRIAAERETWRKMKELANTLPRIVRCANCECDKYFSVKLSVSEPGQSVLFVNCPHCGKSNKVEILGWSATI